MEGYLSWGRRKAESELEVRRVGNWVFRVFRYSGYVDVKVF